MGFSLPEPPPWVFIDTEIMGFNYLNLPSLVLYGLEDNFARFSSLSFKA